MAFSSLWGQPVAQATLRRAVASRKVHHAYRFEGPDGVGKEHAARLLCQALLCTEDPEGCGTCNACTRVASLSPEPPQVPLHPDVVLVERGLYPAASIDGSSEATGISVGQVRRVVLPRVGFSSHEGRALCVIVRRAEELTVAAANALLKTLEEPPPNTHFVLLTSRPGMLLDTIASRTLSVRFGPLPSAVLQDLMAREGLDPSAAARAEGSLERARQLCAAETREREEAFLQAADAALEAPHVSAALEFAAQRSEDRGELRADLAHLARSYAERATQELASRSSAAASRWARRHEEVLKALTAVDRNASPTLLLEAMMTRLRAMS